jgi:hypothetical protein
VILSQNCEAVMNENLVDFSNYKKIDSIFKESLSSSEKLTIVLIETNRSGVLASIFELDSLGKYSFSIVKNDSLIYFRSDIFNDTSFFYSPLDAKGAFQARCSNTLYSDCTKTILVRSNNDYFLLTSLDGELEKSMYENNLYYQDFMNYSLFVENIKKPTSSNLKCWK